MEEKDIIQGEVQDENVSLTPEGDENQSGEVENQQVVQTPQDESSSRETSRAQERIQELLNRIKTLEQTIEAQRLIQQPTQTQQEEEYVDPEVEIKRLKQEINVLKTGLAYFYEQQDKAMTKQKYPDYDKYEALVEEQLQALRRVGQNVPREQIYLMIKAKELLSKPYVPEKKEVKKPIPETKTTKPPVKKPASFEELGEQLKDVKF